MRKPGRGCCRGTSLSAPSSANRSVLRGTPLGVSGDKRLSQLGVTTQADGTLALDSTVLNAALRRTSMPWRPCSPPLASPAARGQFSGLQQHRCGICCRDHPGGNSGDL